jgi:hypothetical protein
MRDVDGTRADVHRARVIRQETLPLQAADSSQRFTKEIVMGILCAQYAVEVQFENYVDGNTINHEALEVAFRTALQDALDKLQYIDGGVPGYRMVNPLIMPMSVTSVKYETDYPHPDSLPDDLRDYTEQNWAALLRSVDELTLSELTDVAYVADRIEVHAQDLDPPLEDGAVRSMAELVVAFVKSTC